MNQFARERLSAILHEAAKGVFPPADGGVTVLPQPSERDAGVWGFTAHAVVFAGVEPAWVTGQLPAGDLGAPLGPPFLQALCAATGMSDVVDVSVAICARDRGHAVVTTDAADLRAIDPSIPLLTPRPRG